MLFSMKHDLRQMAAKLAADFFSPAGPIPVERLIARHIDAFENMRASGLTWEQISRLLAGAEIARGDGSAFSPSHLRGVYGRQRKRLQEKRTAKPLSRMVPFPNTGSSYPAAQSDRPPLSASMRATVQVANPRTAAAIADAAALQVDINALSLTGGSETPHGGMAAGASESPPEHDRPSVLAMMRQAALARRST